MSHRTVVLRKYRRGSIHIIELSNVLIASNVREQCFEEVNTLMAESDCVVMVLTVGELELMIRNNSSSGSDRKQLFITVYLEFM